MKPDHWTEGYRAALNGATYADNPYEGKPGATPWAFGCSEGMKERNRCALAGIMAQTEEAESRAARGVTLAHDPARPWYPESAKG